MPAPRISFIVAACDVAPYIDVCLHSLLADHTIDIEVVVVDDGSIDATRELLHRYAAHDTRVRVLCHDANRGPGIARNTGLAAASGDFVWFVDGDDWLLDGAARVIASHLDDAVDITFVDYERVFGDGHREPSFSGGLLRTAPTGTFDLEQWPAIVRILHVPWNKIFRRAFLDGAGLAFPSGRSEDIPFTYRALLVAQTIQVEPTVSYAYRSGRAGALTHRPVENLADWSEQWLAVLRAATDRSSVVRTALFDRMVWHGWAMLADPHRLLGRKRRQFFRRFVTLYSEERMPEFHTSLTLESGSWTLGRVRLAARSIHARLRGVATSAQPVLSSVMHATVALADVHRRRSSDRWWRFGRGRTTVES